MNTKAAGAVTVATLAWAAWLTVVPLIAAANPGTVALVAVAVTYRAGALICHQIPDRSFHLAGVQVPVCARCLGLYAGAAAGAVAAFAWAWRRERKGAALRAPLSRVRAVIIILIGATAALWVGEQLGVIALSRGVRFAAALPPGMAVGAMVALWAGGAAIDDNAGGSAIH